MKKRKRLLAVLLAAGMAMNLGACGGGGSKGASPSAGTSDGAAIDHDRQIVYGSASMITNFNMKYITSGNDIAAADQVYDTLVRKVNGEIVGCLADKWEISGDGLDYTFHLREGATFSPGDPITSEDIFHGIYTRRMQPMGLGSRRSGIGGDRRRTDGYRPLFHPGRVPYFFHVHRPVRRNFLKKSI